MRVVRLDRPAPCSCPGQSWKFTARHSRRLLLLFNLGFDIVQVLQEGPLCNPLKQKPHGDGHYSCNNALRNRNHESSPAKSPTDLCNAHGGDEYKSITFCPGLVELVLRGVSDPLFRGRLLAEERPGLAPRVVRRARLRVCQNLNALNPADEFRGVRDVG